jgi:hypothetical protein
MTIIESNVTINVKDLDKSILYYESIGLTTKSRWTTNYAQLTAPGLLIGLHPSRDIYLTGNSGNISIGFITDDFEGARSLLQKLSIETTDRQEEGGRFLTYFLLTLLSFGCSWTNNSDEGLYSLYIATKARIGSYHRNKT